MQIEYFQLIDRIVDLDIGGKTITVEAQVPEQSTIFEGHFPGYPIMPGVLLTEAMAQSSGWLLLGLMKFERMPFLAMIKEAKMRGFVSPGRTADDRGKGRARGLGLCGYLGEGPRRRRTEVQRRPDLPPYPLPPSRLARAYGCDGPQDRLSAAGK